MADRLEREVPDTPEPPAPTEDRQEPATRVEDRNDARPLERAVPDPGRLERR